MRRDIHLRVLQAVCLTSIVLLASTQLVAQRGTALLTGTVKDPSGAVISGAKVTLTNLETNVSQTTTTNKDGYYLFPLVPIGRYQVTIEQAGFRKFVQKNFSLELNQNGHLDATLQVGSEGQVVEVTGEIAQVDTVTATLGKVETTQRIESLPLVDRDALQLGLLQAGVFAPDSDDGSNNPFSVSGQRSESMTFLIDGADNTDFLGNNIVVNPNPDSIAEFKILTNNYNAEYGRTSGGIINQVIKSGTNSFHGGLFEFFRNDVLNAKDYFLPVKAPFKRNVFGGDIGGPIIKDKTFFFVSYQGARRREGQTAGILQVLSPAERKGDFSELLPGTQLINPVTGTPYLNNQVPVNPVIKNYIDKYLPLPNLPGNNFIAAPVARIRDDQFIVRVDHHISQNDTLAGVYLFDDTDDLYPYRILKGASTGGNVPVGSSLTDGTRYQTGSLTWTHIIKPNLLNEARFAGNRRAALQAVPVDRTTPAQLGFTNVNPDDPNGAAPPIIFTNSFNLGPDPQGPTTEHDVTFQVQDTVSWTHGSHDFKFGVDIHRVQNNFNFDFFNNGSYDFTFGNFTGNEFADFVGGFPDNYFQFSNARYGIRTSSYHAFVQDSWKIHPRLTLDLGLRYEYNTPQTDPHNNVLGFFPGRQSSVFPNAPPNILYPGDPGTPNNALLFPDRNNFAPRFGFAWDVLGNAKLVMRGGFGIFYDIEDGAFNLQFGGQPPFGSVSNFFYGANNFTGDAIADPFGALGVSNPYPFVANGRVGTFFQPKISFAYVVDPHFRVPYSENFNFGFQYQLTKDTMVEAVYVGSLGRKLIATEEVNFPQPAILAQQLNVNGGFNSDCARPLAACPAGALDPSGTATQATVLDTNTNASSSDSHQFQLTVDKRFSHGFTLRGAYTWSKTMDELSGFRARSTSFTNPLDHSFDRGLADFDAPHRFVLSWVWDLPFDHYVNGRFAKAVVGGWELNGILTFQSGNPFTLFQENNSSGQENFLDRPDQLGPISYVDPRTVRTFSPDPNGFNGSCLNGPQTGNFWFDPSSFDCVNVPLLTYGNMRRNTLRGPGINNWDLSIAKKFRITERNSLELRSEFFNAFNHAQFLTPNYNGFSGNFGQITTARAPRIIQLALKYYF